MFLLSFLNSPIVSSYIYLNSVETDKLEWQERGIPWWSSGKNLPSSAGDMGSIPGRGTKISHAVGQLSPHTTTPELMRLN